MKMIRKLNKIMRKFVRCSDGDKGNVGRKATDGQRNVALIIESNENVTVVEYIEVSPTRDDTRRESYNLFNIRLTYKIK